MDWRVKALVQGVLSKTPGGMRLNSALQVLAGGRRNLARHIDDKVVDDWLVHARHLRELNFELPGRVMLEVGTGWLPVMPLCFALAGVGRCITVDLNRHLQLRHVSAVLARLGTHLDAMAQACGQPTAQLRQRWQALAAIKDGAALLQAAGIEYLAPGDATATGLGDASVDLVFSNSVLEHVPATVLAALMCETVRMLRHDGLALHNVNCGDHYAYFDRSITAVDYLRFSEREWRRWNNELLFQNRLRAIDFVHAAQAAGLHIVMDHHRPRADLLARMNEITVAEPFRHLPNEELCCTSVDFAATPRQAHAAQGDVAPPLSLVPADGGRPRPAVGQR